MNKFGSITIKSEININALTEKFDVIDYDDEEYYISKEIFHHDINNEDDGDFRYRYGIMVADRQGYSELNTFSLVIYMIPLSENVLKKLSGYREDIYDNVESIEYAIDCMLEGYCISFESDEYDYSEEELITGEELWEHARLLANVGANLIETINSFRGFYLDKAQNMIGSTGWDMIEDYVRGGESLLQAPLTRYKQMNGTN